MGEVGGYTAQEAHSDSLSRLGESIASMSSTPTPRLSVDSLSPISPVFPRDEYPFPRSATWNHGRADSLTVDRPRSSGRPGSSGRYSHGRRGSTASSINSIGGSLDTASHWHGLNESSQNGRDLTRYGFGMC